MLQTSWQENLRTSLRRLQKPDHPLRLAVLGVGHELYGDDAVGVWLAGRLSKLASSTVNLISLQGGPAPENFTGTLRRFAPDLVLLVDAALMNLEPGQVGWLDWRDTTGFSASTHTLPLNILADYLTTGLGCEVALLGIQPAQTAVGAPLSPEVRKAAEHVAKRIKAILEESTKSNFWKG